MQKGRQKPQRRAPVLQSLRVVDLSMGWAGPLAAMLLADFGAEIIKIESTRRMDWWRADLIGDDPEDRPYEKVAHFNGVNRNKYDCTLDLTDPRAADLLRRLIAASDVLIENYTPRVMENFGLTYEVVRTINPTLVMLSMPAFGSSGPWRDYAAYGNTIDPLSGVTGLTGHPDGSPILASNAYGDPVSGVGGAIGVLMALVQRRRTGRGQHIELSHQELSVHHVSQTLLDYVMNGRVAGRQGNRHPWMAPHGVYPCKGDDEWIAIAVASDEEWEALCSVLCHSDVAADPRFADGMSRWHNQDELDALLGERTPGWHKLDLALRLQEAGICAEPVNSSADVLKDPQIKVRSSFVWMDRKHVGHHPYPGVTARLSATPGEAYMPAPTLGEHNGFVLGELLGLSKEGVQNLERDGAIGNRAEAPESHQGMQ
ncbi:MAG: CaiB/BaiF CoA transferase family protein [Dehalococcoidia bacterium]